LGREKSLEGLAGALKKNVTGPFEKEETIDWEEKTIFAGAGKHRERLML